MKIGILKEEKNPPDERVPLSPVLCKEILDKHAQISIVVQKSNVRRFKDEEYAQLGIKLVDDVADCDILMGVKEVPKENLIPNKTYLYFSHTIKKQPHNRSLLIEMLQKNIHMVDYETLTNKAGVRLIGFGKYAGIVGTYNTFYAYGKRAKTFDLKRAYLCADRKEMENELTKISLPTNYKIVITGGGRVAKGIKEILSLLKIKQVDASTFLSTSFNEPVFAQLSVLDYVKRNDGKPFVENDFYQNPTLFSSNFMPFAKAANMYISGHFWDKEAPFIFSKENAKLTDFKIKIIGDISCDVNGPIACTIRSSTIKDPLYGYNPLTEKEVAFDDENAITVMAVDNLPCELPKDASEEFGREFIDKVLPHLLNNDKEGVMERATICKNGNLTPDFEYLSDYVKEGVINANEN